MTQPPRREQGQLSPMAGTETETGTETEDLWGARTVVEA